MFMIAYRFTAGITIFILIFIAAAVLANNVITSRIKFDICLLPVFYGRCFGSGQFCSLG